jgi:hypothetical protein
MGNVMSPCRPRDGEHKTSIVLEHSSDFLQQEEGIGRMLQDFDAEDRIERCVIEWHLTTWITEHVRYLR